MFTLHILKFKLTGKLAVYKTVSATKLILKLNLFCLSAMNIQFYVYFFLNYKFKTFTWQSLF